MTEPQFWFFTILICAWNFIILFTLSKQFAIIAGFLGEIRAHQIIDPEQNVKDKRQ